MAYGEPEWPPPPLTRVCGGGAAAFTLAAEVSPTACLALCPLGILRARHGQLQYDVLSRRVPKSPLPRASAALPAARPPARRAAFRSIIMAAAPCDGTACLALALEIAASSRVPGAVHAGMAAWSEAELRSFFNGADPSPANAKLEHTSINSSAL